MTEDNILDRLAAEIRRLEEQRDAAAARIERAAQSIKEPSPQRDPSAYAAGETAVAEFERAKDASTRERAAAEMPRSAASAPSRMIGGTQPHRDEEEPAIVHRKRYEELAEERYEVEVEIEEALSKLVEGLKRLKVLNADQHREAEAAGIPMEYNLSELIERRLSVRLKRWMPEHVVSYAEAFDKPLYEIDDGVKHPKKAGPACS